MLQAVRARPCRVAFFVQQAGPQGAERCKHMGAIPEQDFLVVGGGVTGAALAYGLAGPGRKVTVLDAPTATDMSSRANVGLIWCQSKFLHLPRYAQWGFASSRLFPAFLQELEEVSGQAVPARHEGGLIPVMNEAEYDKRHKYIENLRAALGEYRGGMLSRSELEAKLPGVAWGREVCGAAWCEEDGLVDALALLRALRAALPKVGVRYTQGLACAIAPLSGGGFAVESTAGRIACRRLVLAAGLANRRLARFALPHVPIFPDKGQVLLMERLPFVMPTPVLGATQTLAGTTIVGFRHENVGHDMEVHSPGVAEEGRWAMRVWPRLAQCKVLRTWAAPRVMPQDGMAIYSRLPGHPDAFLCNTHSAVTLTAAHARLLPQLLLDGRAFAQIEGMDLARFGFSC